MTWAEVEARALMLVRKNSHLTVEEWPVDDDRFLSLYTEVGCLESRLRVLRKRLRDWPVIDQSPRTS